MIRLGLLLLLLQSPVFAETFVEGFEDPGLDARYKELTNELRCLVCQNQSLADSNADLAKDMRREVHKQLAAGKSNTDIVDFLVVRYGDFVRYRPPVKPMTWMLWFGPFMLLMVGGVVLFANIRRKHAEPASHLSGEQHDLARKLLDDNPKDNNT